MDDFNITILALRCRAALTPLPRKGGLSFVVLDHIPSPHKVQIMFTSDDYAFAEMAISEAKKCKSEPGKISPLVGAVAVKDGKVLATAHRGELSPGEHAEFTLLEKKLSTAQLAGATIYTTLEPCTTRNHPKICCMQRLIERKVARVMVGMHDPNKEILGKGIYSLQERNIEVVLFPQELINQIKEINREFVRDQEIKAASPQINSAVRSGGSPNKLDFSGTEKRVNAYKLFYFRNSKKISRAELAKMANVEISLLKRLERIDQEKGSLNANSFSTCDADVLSRLEERLDCKGRLETGQADDFLTQFVFYYETNKNARTPQKKSIQMPLGFTTKAVVFDFGGTLTRKGGDTTTWEKLWAAVGYPHDQCVELHSRFRRNEFNHQQWCDLTCEALRQNGLSEKHLKKIAKDVKLVKGAKATINKLRNRGIQLFIVSGSLKSIINYVLGDLAKEFVEIRANEILFDRQGIISSIVSSPYDFEGKARFLSRIMDEYSLSSSEVLYVGNSCNDTFASQSGARTLCVNPHFTDPDDDRHWTYAIPKMEDLAEILKYVHP